MKRTDWTFRTGTAVALLATGLWTGCGSSNVDANAAIDPETGEPVQTEANQAVANNGAVANSGPNKAASEAVASKEPANSNGGGIFSVFSRSRDVIVPQGTAIKIRTTTAISTKTAEPGQKFAASLLEPLVIGNDVIAPAGASVEGTVAESDEGGRVKGVASIAIRLTELATVDGNIGIQTGTYTKQAAASKKDDAVKVGIGAGIGAAIGAIAGGGKGAAIGAASGGGAGTGVVLATRGDPAVIASESIITFELTEPFTVEVDN